MLSSKNRLQKKKEFRKILKEGKGYKEDFLILKLAPKKKNEIRFGFMVSQKISKKATVRNQIRRRLSDLARSKLDKLKRGNNLIFIALPGIEKKDFWELEIIMDNLFKRAKLYELFG